MTTFDTMLADLRSLRAMLIRAREAAWFGQGDEQRVSLDRMIAQVDARITHLESLPQRGDPFAEP